MFLSVFVQLDPDFSSFLKTNLIFRSRANDEYVNIKNTKDEFQKWICRLQTIDGAVASQLIDYFDQINEGSMHLKKKARDMLIYFDDSIHPDAKEIINKLLNFFQ